jgi:hypothetical protein
MQPRALRRECAKSVHLTVFDDEFHFAKKEWMEELVPLQTLFLSHPASTYENNYFCNWLWSFFFIIILKKL